MLASSDLGSSSQSRVGREGKVQGGSSRYKRSGIARNKQDKSKQTRGEKVEDSFEGDLCIICAEKIQYAALRPCNHTTCHVCAFRQRALYEKKNCLVCRSENDRIVISEQVGKNYSDFGLSDFVSSQEDKYKIDFTQNYVRDETLRLLENECGICHEIVATFKELGDHAKEVHGKYYCLICSKYKMAFKIELPLYHYKSLQKHQSQGDESGFMGHPECKHCRGKRFYSEDELNVHVRDRHERCHICDQTTPKTADYYKNYESLYQHFSQAHYVCTVASCVEKRFVVFGNDLDLTAHMLKEHGGLSNGNRIVIGSNSLHYSNSPRHFSQLSTFNNSRWLSANSDQDEDQQSPEIKKKRFEERAKHYLNYNQEKYNEFEQLNRAFKSKKINAKELLQIYKQNLFIHQTIEELNLLVKEFLEFFPQGGDLQKDLLSILVEKNEEAPTEQFPVLGGRPVANSFSTNGWIGGGGGGGGRSGTASPVDNFPPLKKPTKVNYLNPNEQPIRYSTVVKKSQQPKKKASSSAAATVYSSPYIPNYLDNTKSETSSTPSLGKNGSLTASKTNPCVNDAKFPVLQKKTNKKVIPRVNEVKTIDPNSWRQSSQSQSQSNSFSAASSEANESGIEILDKRKLKMKKKQDRLLFSNAF